MVSSSFLRFIAATIPVTLLSACVNVPLIPLVQEDSRGQEEATAHGFPVDSTAGNIPRDELLVETLVYQARELGDLDIGGVRRILNRDGQSGLTDEAPIEPVTPTIPMTANRIVERAINDLLQNRRSLLKVWLERGATYFPMIEQIFEEEGVPDELKYLALGESSLQPTARSPAGATGMWQFMAGTARGAGLTIDTWVDERRDPEKSTRAAARHFKELYAAYGNNWHLALAGYNCSYRCITRAVRQAGGSLEDPPSFWEIYPYLPRETSAFVPHFIAAALIISNPDMYGIEVEDLGQELTYDVVKVSGMLRLEDAARLAGTNVATLRKLNPSLLRATLPDGDEAFELKIPAGTYGRFVTAFESLPESEKSMPGEYIVQGGDTLDGIARKYGTTVSELQAINGIRGHLIYPEQQLLIPNRGVNRQVSLITSERVSVQYGKAKFRPIKLQDAFQLVKQKGSTKEEPLMAVSLSTPVDEEAIVVPTVYEVRRGDTLGQIAQRFGVTVRELQSWNNLRGTLIRAGQELTLHTTGTPGAPKIYQVRRGDSLASIARRFGVTVENLKRLNGLSGDMIYPGQALQLN